MKMKASSRYEVTLKSGGTYIVYAEDIPGVIRKMAGYAPNNPIRNIIPFPLEQEKVTLFDGRAAPGA